MSQGPRTPFIYPFTLGVLCGVVGGTTLGALLGQRVLSGVIHLVSVLSRRDRDELRFDLFLQ